MLIRRAVEDDGDPLLHQPTGLTRRVHVRSWQATYRGTVSDDVLDALDQVERGRRWRYRLSHRPWNGRLVGVSATLAWLGRCVKGGPADGGQYLPLIEWLTRQKLQTAEVGFDELDALG